MYGSTARGVVAAACALTVVASACATTIEEQPAGGAEPPAPGTVVDADAPEITVPVAGSAAELLPDMAAEMSTLGSLIAEDGDAAEALSQIQQIWAAIRSEVETNRPELVNAIDTTVQMSVTAVERRRPADADKAFQLLTNLVDNYTGDG
jgi:ABC-type Fe3+-hydroxamate transport system substrate-binding protein